MENKVFSISDFNHTKNYVLEASAGTGKTYNIVEIVKKLVNENNIDLNKILIVTFTEKAAGELKDRIRQNVKNVDVDNAPIYTIHSFCQNVIKEFGLSAKLPLNLSVINNSELKEFAERYIREGEIVDDIAYLLQYNAGFKIDDLVGLFIQGVQKYYLDKDFNEDPSVIMIENKTIYLEAYEIMKKCSKAKDFDDLLASDATLRFHYENLANCTSNTYAVELSKNIRENYLKSFNFNGTKFTDKRMSTPLNVQQAYQYFKSLKELYKKIKGCKLIGIKYLKDFYTKWQQEKELNKSQTFDDMIRYVREAIIHDNLLKDKLKAKYTYAIIDEFQDTNQRQFDIFKNIFMDDSEHKIIVVGDPKQSIYSFQGADIDVYYNAKNDIINLGGEVCRLNTNYRSTKDMVQSCNNLFHYYNFGKAGFEDCGYLSNSTDKKYYDILFDEKPTKAFWIAENNQNIEVDEQEFAMIAVQKIIACCTLNDKGETRLRVKDKESSEFRNVSFKDFAVLARTKAEMIPIEKALKNAGIPYLRYKDQQLFKGKECAQWIALLNAIISPDFTGHNRKILKKVLFTKFFGLTLEQINSEYVNKDSIQEVETINRWKVIASTHHWKELFDDIIDNSQLTVLLKSLKELQSLAIYKQIASYCIEYLSKGKSLEELIRNLTSLSNDGSLDSDELDGTIIEKSTNFDCVQIMTIYAAKGLQFPVVISVAGFKERANLDKVFPIRRCDESGIEKKLLEFDGPSEYKKCQIAEWHRLFYVAYTRPQYLLILPNYEKWGEAFLETSIRNFMNDNKFGYLSIYNSYKTFEELRSETSKILMENEKINDKIFDVSNQSSQNLKLKKLIDSKNKKKIYKHSYSSLSHGESVVEEFDDEEDKEGSVETTLSMFDKLGKPIAGSYDETILPLDIPLDYPRGAKLGTALHEIFEGLDFKNSSNNLEQKIKYCFEKQAIILKDEWKTSTIQIVENVLSGKLPVIKGAKVTNEFLQLKNISFDNKLDEVEFNFNLIKTKLKNYCNGFVDMIFKNGDYYSIVDWKSDRLNDEFINYCTIDSLKKHVDECYSIQRVLYSYCLIKWLHQAMPTKTYSEIFNEHFGGVYYIFLRGCNKDTTNGIYAHTWDSWDDLETSFNEIIKYKVGGTKND